MRFESGAADRLGYGGPGVLGYGAEGTACSNRMLVYGTRERLSVELNAHFPPTFLFLSPQRIGS